MPPSLAKAKVKRDTEARSAKPEAKAMMMIPLTNPKLAHMPLCLRLRFGDIVLF